MFSKLWNWLFGSAEPAKPVEYEAPKMENDWPFPSGAPAEAVAAIEDPAPVTVAPVEAKPATKKKSTAAKKPAATKQPAPKKSAAKAPAKKKTTKKAEK